MTARLKSSRGQSLIEFALIMPFVLVVALGVVEVGYALLDQHVVTKLTREGSNLISRDVSINDAVTAMRSMSTRPVDFNTRSRMIFSVLRKGSTPGTANYDQVILYQRYELRQPHRDGYSKRAHDARDGRIPRFPRLRSRQCGHRQQNPDREPAGQLDAPSRWHTVRHRDFHPTRSDHSPERFRSHRAEHAVLDCVFLSRAQAAADLREKADRHDQTISFFQ